MLRTLRLPALTALALVAAPAAGFVLALPQPAAAQAPATTDAGAKFTAFLDAEFAEDLKSNPQGATQLGIKDNQDKLNDQTEAAELKRLEWRRGSVARMKAQFQRAKLPLEGRISYDMWAQELDRAELAYQFRRYDFPLGGNAAHSGLPSFLISSHLVDSPADMAAYNARLRGLGPAMDQTRDRVVAAAADGIRMPRFQYERVIAESKKLTSGQPFDATGPDSPLWTDAKAKVAKLSAAGKVTPAEAQALLDDAKAALLTSMKPGYERLIAWAEGDFAKAPSGKVGAANPAERPGLVSGGADAADHDQLHARPGPPAWPLRGQARAGRDGRPGQERRLQGRGGLLRRAEADRPAPALHRREPRRDPGLFQRPDRQDP